MAHFGSRVRPNELMPWRLVNWNPVLERMLHDENASRLPRQGKDCECTVITVRRRRHLADVRVGESFAILNRQQPGRVGMANAERTKWIGFDLGGTKMLATVFDAELNPL